MQNIHISTTIKSLCKAKGISITSLLHDCKLTKSFIYDLEKRSASPSCEKITKIADYLDCSVDYLLGRTDVVEVARSEEYVVLPIAARNKKGSSKSAEPHKLTKQQWEEAQEALSDLPDRKELPKFNLDEDY